MKQIPTVLARAQARANGWDQEQKQGILQKLAEISAAFDGSGDSGEKDHAAFIRSLGFAMLDLVGRNGVAELLRRD